MRTFTLVCLASLLVLCALPVAAEGPDSRHGSGHDREAGCAGLARALDVFEALAAGDDGLHHPGWRDAGRSKSAHDHWGGWWTYWLRTWARRISQTLAQLYAGRCVDLNQVQVLGSHNSYHIEPLPELIDTYVLVDPAAIAWEYTHRPFAEQFGELGVRQIEIDVFADPDGGLFAEPFGLALLGGETHIPELDPPGIKVLHVQDLDWDTQCYTLVACLERVKAWSDANSGHLPLVVLVEIKDDPIPDPGFGFVVPIEFGADELDDLDAEIRSVFPESQLITPDDVRRGARTLEDAVLTHGWLRLERARGRVLFAMDNAGEKRELYRAGRPSLEGRVLFTNAMPGDADAAFVKVNGPVGNEDLIQDLVAEGYIVRTRADSDTMESRTGDTTRREAAIASGAQYVSSDYPEPDPRFTDYFVEIPDGEPGRCNPVNAPPGCRSFALER